MGGVSIIVIYIIIMYIYIYIARNNRPDNIFQIFE